MSIQAASRRNIVFEKKYRCRAFENGVSAYMRTFRTSNQVISICLRLRNYQSFQQSKRSRATQKRQRVYQGLCELNVN